MFRSLFDQTVTVQSTNPTDDAIIPALLGIVAAADAALIDALARENISLSVVVYTSAEPNVAVGDSLVVNGMAYPVVAPTRPYASGALNMRVYVTPCGAGTAT